MFKIIDDNNNKKLEFDEFKKGVNEYGLDYSKDELMNLFNILIETIQELLISMNSC